MSALIRVRESLSRLRPAAVGYVDGFDGDRITGWAVDPDDPTRPARLSLMVDGQHVMNVVAALPREDVASTGRAPLRCGFDAALPPIVRDGAAHRVELRLTGSNRLLRRGRRKIDARAHSGAGLPGLVSGPVEGLVWFDRARGAVAGWASGVATLEIAVDDNPAEAVELTREVPGFGLGNGMGFEFPLPPTLADGAWHSVSVRAGDLELQGSPVRMRLDADRPRIRLSTGEGRTVSLAVHDASGTPVSPDVTVWVDGAPLAPSEAEMGRLSFALPTDARHLVVTDGTDSPGTVLGRYVVSPGMAVEDWSADVPAPELDAAELEDGLCAEATAAFAAFCDAPDDRFDPLWYASTFGVDPDGALTHWRDSGAAAGNPPGPDINEDAARALHPAVARAIADGRLPCAFALELVLGRGALGSLTGLAPEHRARPAMDAHRPAPLPDPVPRPLPEPAALRDPASSIYAAWLARLAATPEERGQIDADDAALRRDIATLPLDGTPLVSIIMPTWNRAFTIGEAIQSVLEQSYGNWELLVCDDASEDRTADVVRGFDDPRIRYMRFVKSNGAGARNNGLRFARGSHIAYLDSDNIWHPLFLDRMLRALWANPGMPIAYCAYLDTEIEGARVQLADIPRPAFRPVQLSNKNFMDLNTIMHHRRVTDWMGAFDERLPRLQDWDMMLRHTSVFRATFVDRIGVFYRRNIAWGQVTQTQIGSGAQNTVNEKTRARLAGDHARLAIDWPTPPRMAILVGTGEGGADAEARLAMARGLMDVAPPDADTRLIVFGEGEEGAIAGADIHRLPVDLTHDPQRLGHAIGRATADRAVLAVGVPRAALRAMPDIAAGRVLTLGQSVAGHTLVSLADPTVAFQLGAVPLDAPSGAVPTDAILGLGRGAEALRDPAKRLGLGLRLPARDASDLRQAPKLVVAMSPVADLDPWDFALMQHFQANGVPVALPPAPDDPSDFGRQWIDARAAYALNSSDPKWIGEKLGKLMADPGALTRLSERGTHVHAIAFHPALTRERLAHAIWWVLTGDALP